MVKSNHRLINYCHLHISLCHWYLHSSNQNLLLSDFYFNHNLCILVGSHRNSVSAPIFQQFTEICLTKRLVLRYLIRGVLYFHSEMISIEGSNNMLCTLSSWYHKYRIRELDTIKIREKTIFYTTLHYIIVIIVHKFTRGLCNLQKKHLAILGFLTLVDFTLHNLFRVFFLKT